MSVSWDASDANRLAADLGKAAAQTVPKLAVAVKVGGKLLETAWRVNAVATSGVHGKHYPRSIKSTSTGVLEAEIGPDPGMPQGGMSFEFGSSKQPPHLDGARALEKTAPPIMSLIEKAAGDLL